MTQELSEAEATPVWVVVGTDDDEGALYGVFASPELAQEHADEFDDGTVIVQCEPVIGSEAAGGTVPTNNEEAAALIEAIYATSTPAGSIPRTAWPFPVSVTELANGILAAGFRRPPVLGDNAELGHIAMELLKHGEASYQINGTDWWWECSCGHGFGQLDGSSVPAGVSVISWRMAEHRAEAALSASQPREAAPSDVDGVLAMLDDLNASGGITYDAYSRLHDAVALLGPAEPVQVEVTEPHVPVHSLRYHQTENHIWLECSIDGGPWLKVPSSYGDQSDDDRECETPNVGMVAGIERHAAWRPLSAALGGGDQ